MDDKALGGLAAALQSLTADREVEIEQMLGLVEGGTLSPALLAVIKEAVGDAVVDQDAATERLWAC